MKRTIIITGGTTGIGKATAYQFAKNGWNVVITSRSEKKGQAFVEEAKNEGLDMTFFQLDVTNEEQVAQVIEQTVAKFGKLDSIVNNSGISLGAAPLADTETDESLRRMPRRSSASSITSCSCARSSRTWRSATESATSSLPSTAPR